MPRLKTRAPRMFNDRGRAYVKIDGLRFPLGKWGTDEAREVYDRLIAEWLANGRKLPPETVSDEEATVAEVLVDYFAYAKSRGKGGDVDHIKQVFRLTRQLYGREPASSFGPKRLQVVRQRMIDRVDAADLGKDKKPLARGTINRRTRWVVKAFQRAVANEKVDVSVHHALLTVQPLKKGEGGRETKRVKPVPPRDVRLTRRHLPTPVRAMVDLQLLTGARPSELTKLCEEHLDMSHKGVWLVDFDGSDESLEHKKDYIHKRRVVYFGPKAQKILKMFMTDERPKDQPLFSPKDTYIETARRRGTKGRRPNQKPNPRKTDRTVGDCYSSESYRKAVVRVCKEQKIAHWTPYRLRHNSGTALRRQFDLETASCVLGHSSLVATLTYAEANDRRAREAIAKVG